jgi:hypothetical protein
MPAPASRSSWVLDCSHSFAVPGYLVSTQPSLRSDASYWRGDCNRGVPPRTETYPGGLASCKKIRRLKRRTLTNPVPCNIADRSGSIPTHPADKAGQPTKILCDGNVILLQRLSLWCLATANSTSPTTQNETAWLSPQDRISLDSFKLSNPLVLIDHTII